MAPADEIVSGRMPVCSGPDPSSLNRCIALGVGYSHSGLAGEWSLVGQRFLDAHKRPGDQGGDDGSLCLISSCTMPRHSTIDIALGVPLRRPQIESLPGSCERY